MIYPFDDKGMTSVGTNLASVRKHCACWDTGPSPGAFHSGQIDASMVPGATEDCAIEAIFVNRNTSSPIIWLNDIAGSGNMVMVRLRPGEIRAYMTSVGSGGEQNVATPAAYDRWYHAVAHWQDSGAGTVRVELLVNGVSVGATGYFAKNPWVGAVGSYMQLGHAGGSPYLTGRIALARYFRGAPPAASYLYDVPYLNTTAAPTLKCQWDMGPGYGNTAVDTTGVLDIPWVPVDQPNAIYSSYRYTGQCRGDRWMPP